MHINPSIFREYDIRGIVETDFKPEVLQALGRAYASYLHKRGISKITLGADNRLSAEHMKSNLLIGLLSSGMEVIDIGTVISPLFYYSLYHFEVNGGIMITGSHNPKEYNGMKMALDKSTIYGEDIQELKAIIEKEDFISGPGQLSQADINQDYLNMLISKITLGPKKLKVVVDCGNGTGSLFAQDYFDKLGCDIIPLYCESDGNFPNHHPDPVKRENLQELIKTVLENKADLGIAFDGDADRIGVVDDKGEIIWGDTLMILFWREILPKYKNVDCIIEVKCSQSLVDEIEKLGGRPYFYKTGHSLIKAKMKELKAPFTGEMSGHIFFADEFYGFDDAFYAAGRLLRILSNTDKKLSENLADVTKYYSTAETRVDCPDEIKFSIIEKIKENVLQQYDAITVDGVRILFSNGWGLVRASNTQPVLVTRCEANSKEKLKAYTDKMEELFAEVGLEKFEWEY